MLFLLVYIMLSCCCVVLLCCISKYKPWDSLKRASLKWPALSRVTGYILTESVSCRVEMPSHDIYRNWIVNHSRAVKGRSQFKATDAAVAVWSCCYGDCCRGDRCSDGSAVPVPSVKLLMTVLDAEPVTVSVSGIRSQAVDEYDLSHGVHLFPDVIIDAVTRTEHKERNSDEHAQVCSFLSVWHVLLSPNSTGAVSL